MKRHGIEMTLPPGDPMRAAHLLGDDWKAFRWYDTEAEREAAWDSLHREGIYYRRGEVQSLSLKRVDR